MNALASLYAEERERLGRLNASSQTGDYANPVFGQGPKNAPLMLIGEAPGREEAEAGCPFVGKAGRQLDEMLSLAGIDRSKVFITNAVKFRPTRVKPRSVSNRTPERREIQASLALLRAEITLVFPRFIATLGNTPLFAVYALAAMKPPVIGTAHGKPCGIGIDGAAYTLFPLYHPASGIYNRELIGTMKEDLIRLGALVKEANRT